MFLDVDIYQRFHLFGDHIVVVAQPDDERCRVFGTDDVETEGADLAAGKDFNAAFSGGGDGRLKNKPIGIQLGAVRPGWSDKDRIG